MKTTIFILAIITSNLLAQVPDTAWIAKYSGIDSIDNRPVKLMVDQSNNIIVTGIQYTNSGRDDIVTLKYSRDGTLLWSNVYDGPAHKTDEPTHLVLDAYGYIYVAAQSRGIIGFSDCAGIVILKYHPTGELAWAKRFDEQTGNVVYVQGLSVDSKRNIICTTKLIEGPTLTMNELITRKLYPPGDLAWEEHLPIHKWSWCNGINSDDFGNIFLGGWLWDGNGNSDYEFFGLLKYDANGDLQWLSSFRDSAARDAWSEVFTKDENGKFIAAGETEKITGEEVFATVKYDEDGNVIWYREFSPGFNLEVFDITTDNLGNVLWLAEAENDSSYEYENIITKYLVNGDSSWVKRFPNNAREPIALTTDDDGSVYILSNAKLDQSVEGLLLQKLDSEGKTVWTHLGFEGMSEPAIIAIDKDNNIIVCGSYYYESGKSLIKTIKFSESGVSSVNLNSKDVIDKKFTLEQNYPNPFNPTTRIKYTIPSVEREYILPVQLKVYDVLGREIATLVNANQKPGEYEAEFNAANLSAGVYFYQLKAGSFVQTKKMVLIK